jgi:hypothetical protein
MATTPDVLTINIKLVQAPLGPLVDGEGDYRYYYRAEFGLSNRPGERFWVEAQIYYVDSSAARQGYTGGESALDKNNGAGTSFVPGQRETFSGKATVDAANRIVRLDINRVTTPGIALPVGVAVEGLTVTTWEGTTPYSASILGIGGRDTPADTTSAGASFVMG